MGPAIVTADEIPDVRELRLRTYVNDELRQDARVADLIFDIPTLIATISATTTLTSAMNYPRTIELRRSLTGSQREVKRAGTIPR